MAWSMPISWCFLEKILNLQKLYDSHILHGVRINFINRILREGGNLVTNISIFGHNFSSLLQAKSYARIALKSLYFYNENKNWLKNNVVKTIELRIRHNYNLWWLYVKNGLCIWAEIFRFFLTILDLFTVKISAKLVTFDCSALLFMHWLLRKMF